MEEPFCTAIPEGTRLIETFGHWPGEGARRWPLHRERMLRSARRLGFPCAAADLDRAVDGIGPSEVPLRCRLTLDASGAIECTTARFDPAAVLWRIGIATERVSSRDPWLGVKTTHRALYDKVRADLPEGVDEMLFCNERGELCEGTITSLFVIDHAGRRLTPKLSCGLLPGVLREQSLAEGWEEAILTAETLRQAREIFVGNSFRGMIRATWTGTDAP